MVLHLLGPGKEKESSRRPCIMHGTLEPSSRVLLSLNYIRTKVRMGT